LTKNETSKNKVHLQFKYVIMEGFENVTK